MIIDVKKVSLIKSIPTNLSHKIDNLITHGLLSIVDHVRLSNRYKNPKNIL